MGAVQTILDSIPQRPVPQISIEEAQRAYDAGAAAYRRGDRFITWEKQPLQYQARFRTGWLSEALECATLKDVLDRLINNAKEHQYILEAAQSILLSEAGQTKLMRRRSHFQKVANGLEPFIADLRQITGLTVIMEHPRHSNSREGLDAGGADIKEERAHD